MFVAVSCDTTKEQKLNGAVAPKVSGFSVLIALNIGLWESEFGVWVGWCFKQTFQHGTATVVDDMNPA